MQMKAFEIIGSAGDAMSMVMLALDDVANRDMEAAELKIKNAKTELNVAHKIQTDLIFGGFQNDRVNESVSLIMVHAQDHLMNAMLAVQMAEKIINIFCQGEKNG